MRDTAKTHSVEIMRRESGRRTRPTRFASARARLRETTVSRVPRFFADISAATRDTAKSRSAEMMRLAKIHPDRPTPPRVASRETPRNARFLCDVFALFPRYLRNGATDREKVPIVKEPPDDGPQDGVVC